ncbi:patr class II histocompatibility antigen, DO beta chain isoform X3 [Saccopteryx leptura]|uniref:patr class II histocompatibility antigen, DO beta chain isoform X3 n=1 Tax=Saccopteryx leptura TaxID=249018 RepID=UPI00339BFD77
MGSGWVPRVVALLVILTRLDFSVTQGEDTPEDFVIQAKADCYFTNGTDRVRFVVRFIFNLEEYARFDSDLGMFVALTELGRPDVELWNSRPDILARSRASVDALCRRNYELGAPFTVGRRVRPEVTVYPERTPVPQHHNVLLCSVTGFYPGDIEGPSPSILGAGCSVERQPSCSDSSSSWWGSPSTSGPGKVSGAACPPPPLHHGPDRSFAPWSPKSDQLAWVLL